MRAIIFLLIMVSLCGCRKWWTGPEPEPKLKPIRFKFTLTDESGRDLFFGKYAMHNPKDVKVTPNDYSYIELFSSSDSTNFYFVGYTPFEGEYAFLFEFFAERVDTICFSNTKDLLKYDAHFNGNLICIDCSDSKIHEIIIK